MLGPGGVGGFVAAVLARAGVDVVVVAREPTASVIARDGIVLESELLGTFTARPAVARRLSEPVEALILAPKATALAAALARVAADPGLVVPLLNGLDHMEALRARFPGRVAAGAIRIESDRPAAGRIVHTSQFLRIDLAADDPALKEPLARLAQVLGGAGIPVGLPQDEVALLWGKLVRLSAIALTTSAYDLPLGAVRDDPARAAMLRGALAEAVAVALAEGAAVDLETVTEEVWQVHDSLTSSMQRDLAAGRASELDAIGGAVLRAGARHDVPTPTVAALVEHVRARSD